MTNSTTINNASVIVSGTVYRAWWEGMENWIGEALYQDAFSAKLWVPEEYKEYQQEQDEDYRPGIFSWEPIGKFMYHLYEDNVPTGVVIECETVYKVIV